MSWLRSAGVASVLAGTALLSSCTTPTDFGGLDREIGMAMVAERNREIAAEPRGDYYIGRRYVLPHTRFWGFLRRPGKPWKSATLVVMEESETRVPDRLPEVGTYPGWGYDHNREYALRGRFTGATAYDPNANAQLPVFHLSGIELRDESPGYLFNPGERYQPGQVPVPR